MFLNTQTKQFLRKSVLSTVHYGLALVLITVHYVLALVPLPLRMYIRF